MILSLVLSRSSFRRIISAAPGLPSRLTLRRLADTRQLPDWHRLMHSDSYLKMIRLIIVG